MRKYYRLFSAVGVSFTAIGCGYFVNEFIKNDTLKASWTNSYEPSVKWDFNWDRRDPSSLTKPIRRHSTATEQSNEKSETQAKAFDDFELNKNSSKARRHLFLIRHGQYQIKAKEAELMVLTQLGREQAEFTGKRLNEIAQNFKFNKVIHSNMVRAVETADLIRKELPADIPVTMDPLLAEGAPIPPEPPVGHWRPEVYFFTDGSRIEAAFRKYFHRAPPEQLEDSYEIIVCHANVIRYFFCRALQFPAEAWLRFDLAHGSITHIIVKPDGRVGCRVLGESGFQPAKKVSF